ncbi:MAG: TadE/TadG family type IV pilus assembly protein [Armatimonadota bacterium]
MTAMTTRQVHQARGRKGTVSAELALLLPTLVLLLFGILEVGLLVRASAALNHAASEAVRAAAVGATPATLDSRIATNATGIDEQLITHTYRRRSWDTAAAAWGPWVTLGTNGTYNDAVAGDQVQVDLQYPHKLIMGGLLGSALGASDDNRLTLTASAIILRE